MQRLLLLFTLLYSTVTTNATPTDSVSRWGVTLSGMSSNVVSLDKYQKKWMKKSNNGSVALELFRTAQPTDKDSYAADYNYPSIAIGARYTMNGGVRMHRNKDEDWGLAEEVDYDSHLGNTLSLYGTFYRSIHRSQHWETAYSLSGGAGFNSKWYDKEEAVDNELIGTPVLIYFGAGIHQTYHINNHWAIRGSLEFVHHSNGALYRPNKGSNSLGPSIGVVYQPYNYSDIVNGRQTFTAEPIKKYWYVNIAAGIGAKTLLEDWQKTQFRTPSTDPNYRTEHFTRYAVYSLQADIMYRYARRWASGIGIDYFYEKCGAHIKSLDAEKNITIKHSPFTIALAAKHEVFYHNLSLALGLGYYLHKQMGQYITDNEPRYYERVGLHYAFPSLGGLKVGINVKAHLTKADMTEFVVTYPIRLTQIGR
ncbi:acyloxyacyl hydrolase [Prevotella ihumii]|uniref:acyloxyacyl hydrolase n=1 Tax=Prevotella ihumii TaxID=1917878 RepID=UPI00098200D4|nr:acyloxyacyl hydrolase [Prevotella ihumii]